MANHDRKQINKVKKSLRKRVLRSSLSSGKKEEKRTKTYSLPWQILIKSTKPNTKTIATIQRILNLEGKYSNKKSLNKRFKYLKTAKGVYNGPLYIRIAVEKIQPFLKLGTVKRSGRKIRVPYPISLDRSRKMSINSLFNRIKRVRAQNKRKAFAQEIIEVQTPNGKSISYEAYKHYRTNLQINKKNIRYRW